MNNFRKVLLIFFAMMTAVLAPSAMNAQTSGNWIDYRDTDWASDYSQTSFTISTAGQLAQLANMVNNGNSFEGKTITLTANIDLAEHYWTPIGNSSKDFRGTFEGDNKTISNLTINTTDARQGLFGSLASAFVMNVNIVDCNITAGSYAGGIAGNAGWTTISNCSVSGEIHSAGTSNQNYYGGIVGCVSGSSYGNLIIEGNTNTASVSNNTTDGSGVGGIVGYFGRTTKFRNNFSTGVVSGSVYVGTLIGYIDESDYNEYTNNCYPAGLTGAVGSYNTSTGHDIDGASVGFTISAGEGVTISLPTPIKTYNNIGYYMSGAVVNTTAYSMPEGNLFTGYSVNSGSISDPYIMEGEHTLTGATDNVTISGSHEAGTAIDFSELITIDVEDATYDGEAHLQEPVVKIGETTLTKNVDYTVNYSGGCINAGQYTLTVTGNGNYTGSKSATFNVLPCSITNSGIIVSFNSNVFVRDYTTGEYTAAYSGNVITINPSDFEIYDRNNNYYDLTYNTDYTFTVSPATIQAVGDYTLSINGMGNYGGTRTINLHVTYPAPYLNEMVTTTATTATLTWQDESASNWEVEYMMYDPFDFSNPYTTVGSVFTTTTSITLTGLTPEIMYFARVRGIYGESQSQWSYPVSFEPSAKITIGESETGTTNLPTVVNNQYAMSQQIYTAAEIGQAGTIATIEFLSGGWRPVTRTLDVYMVHTSKTTFADGSDWITLTNNDKMFSGDVEFDSWTTISLNTPFMYNGEDNLAIIVHDKTGSTASTEFGCFSVANDAKQSIYIAGESDFNPTSMSGATGTLTSSKNQIRLLMVNKIISTNGNWNVAANWTPSGVPTSSDFAIVNANVTIPDGCVAQAFYVSVGNGSLTIEDGGQLICSNAVTATIEKTIGPWTTGDPVGGWYFIASPIKENIHPSNVNNMLTTENEAPYSFDLYRLNGTTWENYHAHNNSSSDDPNYPGEIIIPVNPGGTTDGSFFLENGQSYLYANANQVTLEFTGATKPYVANYTVEATGWNLVGNPYTFNAYVNQPHYVLNSERTAIVAAESNSAAIAPCTGVIVDGNATFYNEPQAQSNNQGNIQIALAQTVTTRGNASMKTIDNAIVSFNEGSELEKFYFMEQNANLYIPQGTEEYAIAYSNAQGEMPVNFKANVNGSYTITVNPEGVEMSYLHLIDNLTGADIDLLSTQNVIAGKDPQSPAHTYTFTAKTTDYESRFKLVFNANGVENNHENETFAFFSNGDLIIANEGQANLQVIDLTGRILSTETINGSVSKAINATPGVYMLRLTNGENVRTQKIVVR